MKDKLKKHNRKGGYYRMRKLVTFGILSTLFVGGLSAPISLQSYFSSIEEPSIAATRKNAISVAVVESNVATIEQLLEVI